MRGVLVTSVIAVLAGTWLCTAIVRVVAERCGLPIRETLMWFGLVELDERTLAAACERLQLGEVRRRRPPEETRLADGSYG